ncbi:unnamed protein product, partial [Polarella glacialis]
AVEVAGATAHATEVSETPWQETAVAAAAADRGACKVFVCGHGLDERALRSQLARSIASGFEGPVCDLEKLEQPSVIQALDRIDEYVRQSIQDGLGGLVAGSSGAPRSSGAAAERRAAEVFAERFAAALEAGTPQEAPHLALSAAARVPPSRSRSVVQAAEVTLDRNIVRGAPPQPHEALEVLMVGSEVGHIANTQDGCRGLDPKLPTKALAAAVRAAGLVASIPAASGRLLEEPWLSFLSSTQPLTVAAAGSEPGEVCSRRLARLRTELQQPEIVTSLLSGQDFLGQFSSELLGLLADDLTACSLLIRSGALPVVFDALQSDSSGLVYPQLRPTLAKLSASPDFAPALRMLPPARACTLLDLAAEEVKMLGRESVAGCESASALQALLNVCKASCEPPLPQRLAERGAIGLLVAVVTDQGLEFQLRLEAAEALCRLPAPDNDEPEAAVPSAALYCVAAPVGVAFGLAEAARGHRVQQCRELVRRCGTDCPGFWPVQLGAQLLPILQHGLRKALGCEVCLLVDSVQPCRARVWTLCLDVIAALCGRLAPRVLLELQQPQLEPWPRRPWLDFS